MKKNVLTGILIALLPFISYAQGNKGKVESCAPMKDGMICYSENIKMNGVDESALYNAISAWAKEEYGKDIFMSNILCNNGNKSILVSSKVELLLNEQAKTLLKYKMYITCNDNNYKVEVKDLTFQYDPDHSNKRRSYPAEDILADNGKGNMVPSIKDPFLFCNATFFFVQGLFDDIYHAAKKH